MRTVSSATQNELPLADAATASPPGKDVDGEYWRWCPQCGHELHNERCKLLCPCCHYFMSCSDFD